MAAILFFKMRPKLFTGKHLQAKTSRGLFLYSEALEPIIREIEGRFSMMTPFNLEAWVKGKIQHLGKTPRR